jgi:ABC-type nitrate/sulfonate/bicarbonate transport system permease component
VTDREKQTVSTWVERHAAPVHHNGSGQERRRRGHRQAPARRVLRIGVPVLVAVIFFGAWQVASSSGWQPDYILPLPSEVASELWDDRGGFWRNTQATLSEIAVGFPVGVVAGLLVGSLIGLSAGIRSVLYPYVVASQSIPVLATAPLLILWFGFGILPKVIIVSQVVFFPVAIGTVSGLASVPEEALLFGRTLGASSWKLFTKVRIPTSLPYVFSGLKISASYAAVAAIVAEFAGSNEGLGAMMLRARLSLETETIFGALILATLIGVGCFALMSALERVVVPWHPRFRGADSADPAEGS